MPIPGTSEFFVDELALVTQRTERSAARLARDAYVLIERLPCVWAALADGELDWPRARVFIDVLGSTAAGVAEAVVAAGAAGGGRLSLGRLRARLTGRRSPSDADAGREAPRARPRSGRMCGVYPTARRDESSCAAEMPSPVAAACWSTIDELAWMRKNDGDPRPIGQLRALAHADLILRPWDTSRPAVTAVLDRDGAAVACVPSRGRHGASRGRSTGSRSPPPTCGSCSRSWTRSARAGCRRRPAGRCRSRSPTPTARCWPPPSRRGAGAHRPPRLPRPSRHGPAAACGCAVLDRPPRSTGTGPPGAAPVRQDPGSHLPPSRLRAAGRAGRPRPRRPVRRGRGDRLRQPLLPVPPAPPAEDLHARAGGSSSPRRPTAGDHPERHHPHHPATGPARPHRATRPGPRHRPHPGVRECVVAPLPGCPSPRVVNRDADSHHPA